MATKPDDRQLIHRAALSLLNPTVNGELKSIIESINYETTPPLVFSVTGTNRVLSIGNITVTNTINSRVRTVAPIADLIPTFTSGTVTFPASSGGNAVPSVGSNLVITVASGNYLKVAVALDSAGAIVLTAGTEGASAAAATMPSQAASGAALLIGYVLLHNTGGTIDNLSYSTIFQYSNSSVSTIAGPASSTDNAVARFDGTTGRLIQNSAALLTDAGEFQAGDGSLTNPSYGFGGASSNTGIYRKAADSVGFVANGVESGYYDADTNWVLNPVVSAYATARYVQTNIIVSSATGTGNANRGLTLAVNTKDSFFSNLPARTPTVLSGAQLDILARTANTDAAFLFSTNLVTDNGPEIVTIASGYPDGKWEFGKAGAAGDRTHIFYGGINLATTPAVLPASGIYRVSANSLGFAANSVNVGQYSSAGRWTHGPSAGLGTSGSAYHTVYGSIVGQNASAATRFTISSYEGLNLFANLYKDAAGTDKVVRTGTGLSLLNVLPQTSGASTAFNFITNITSQLTADAAATGTNVTILAGTAAGAWTLGDTVTPADITHTMVAQGNNATPVLRLTSNSTNANTWITAAFNSSLATNAYASHLFGRDGSTTNNSAEIAFKYIGSGSTSNLLSLGFYNNGDVVTLAGNGLLSVGKGTGTASAGILFKYDATIQSTLNHYQTDTFTATWKEGANSVTTTTANYTRIGNIVHFVISFTNIARGAGTGTVTVTGLPFTQISQVASVALQYDRINITAGTLLAFVSANVIEFNIVSDSGAASAALTNGLLNATAADMRISGHYHVS